MSQPEQPRPPFPPFDIESATKKVRLAEDAWNSRDPEKVSLAYTPKEFPDVALSLEQMLM